MAASTARKFQQDGEDKLKAGWWYSEPAEKKMKKNEDNLERNDSIYKPFTNGVNKRSEKLTRSEGRMFLEKTVQLNKSTTKYAIIGIHPISFQSVMKICDRSSGSFFSITSDQYIDFIRRIKAVLDENFIVDIYEDSEDRPLTITPLSQNVWRIETDEGTGAALHRITLENLIRFDTYILNDLIQRKRWGRESEEVFEAMHFDTADFTEREILAYLDTASKKMEYGSLRHQLAVDLIINREYLLTLHKYNEGFFNRKIPL